MLSAESDLFPSGGDDSRAAGVRSTAQRAQPAPVEPSGRQQGAGNGVASRRDESSGRDVPSWQEPEDDWLTGTGLLTPMDGNNFEFEMEASIPPQHIGAPPIDGNSHLAAPPR